MYTFSERTFSVEFFIKTEKAACEKNKESFWPQICGMYKKAGLNTKKLQVFTQADIMLTNL